MMKLKTIFILIILCILCSSCTKKETIVQKIDEELHKESQFDEEFYHKVNRYFSMNRGAYTLNDDPYYVFFQPYRVENDDKVMSLKIYMIDNYNSDYYLEYSCIYKDSLVIKEKYVTNNYINYDKNRRIISIQSENGKSTEYEYLCDYEENTYIRKDDKGYKIIIKKMDNGYELTEIFNSDPTVYRYYYDNEKLIKRERISDISKYTYEYRYLDNRIVQREMFEMQNNIKYRFEEIYFCKDGKIEILYHKDDINSERKILLSEFDQYNNWCLAEEYRDGKFYAKYKRVFEYIE